MVGRWVRAALLGVSLVGTATRANLCAGPGATGSPGGVAGVVNTYYPATASASAAAGSVSLGVAGGALQAIRVGDLILVIQMQDASIDSSNTSGYGNGSTTDTYGSGYTAIGGSGLYEFVRATSAVPVTGGTLTFTGQGGSSGLVNGYINAAATGTSGQKRFQIVVVPQYANLALSGTITASRWDGLKGGVAAIDVAGRLTLSGGGGLSASGTGFRGGGDIGSASGSGASTDYRTPTSNAANGTKGEGVAGTPQYLNDAGALLDTGIDGYPGGSRARGAPGNAGGGGTDGNPSANDQNTGGGGGGNGGAGGKGGDAWCPTYASGNCATSGGHPGARIAELGVGRIAMGGGGGGGTTNNSTGTPANGFASSGASGGGIVIVRAGEIAGAGVFAANGSDGNTTVGNDGSGGGGAGGSILIAAVRTVAGYSVSATANGGQGGWNTPAGTGAHGPGGGGGGGFVAATMTASATANGGAQGQTENNSPGGIYYGSTAGTGSSGIAITGASIPGLSSGGECTPTVVKSFAAATTTAGQSNILSVTVTNNNPTTAIGALAFTDTYPANIVNTATPAPAKSCATAATLTAVAAGPSLGVSAAVINAASSCTYSVATQATASGSFTNTVPVGGVTGSYGAAAVSNLTAATASVTVSKALTVTKTSLVYSDPVNGTIFPKAIPGAFVTYTITVANPGSVAIDNNSVVVTDPTATGLDLFVGNIGGAGSGPVLFTDGSPTSGLNYSYVTLASLTDNVDFSKDAGATWSYVPVPDATNADALVTTIRIRPQGAMAAGSSFTIQLRYRVR